MLRMYPTLLQTSTQFVCFIIFSAEGLALMKTYRFSKSPRLKSVIKKNQNSVSLLLFTMCHHI